MQCVAQLMGAGAPPQLVGVLPPAEAATLLLACAPERADDLRGAVQHAFDDRTARASWFYLWGQDAALLSPLQVFLLRALIDSSDSNVGTEPMIDRLTSSMQGAVATPGPGAPIIALEQVVSEAEVPGAASMGLVRITYRFGFGSRAL